MDQSLKQVARGAILALTGRVVAVGLAAVITPVLVRYISIEEYGNYVLATTMLSVFALVATLGIDQGATRFIAYSLGREDRSKLQGVVRSSLAISLLAGTVLAVVLFAISGLVASRIFHNPGLSLPLRIFALGVPFLVLVHIITAIFRGFESPMVPAFFQNVQAGIFLLFLGMVIWLGLSFTGVLWISVAAWAATALCLLALALNRLHLPLKGKTLPVGKELLFFSLPLLGTSMVNNLISWIDPLMLGYLRSPEVVAFYSAALALGVGVLLARDSIAVMYLPVVSRLYSAGSKNEMMRHYGVVTKWQFVIALPALLLLVLFPDVILRTFYGSRYLVSAPALQVIALACILQPSLGLSGMALTAMGQTRFLLVTASITLAIHIVLNLILIPSFGFIGAAISFGLASLAGQIINTLRLFRVSRMHPFTRSYLKTLGLAVLLFSPLYVVLRNLPTTPPLWVAGLTTALLLGLYAFLMLFTRSLDREDVEVLLMLERRLGIRLTPVKRLLARFI